MENSEEPLIYSAHACSRLTHSSDAFSNQTGGRRWWRCVGVGGDLLVSVYLPPHPSPPPQQRSAARDAEEDTRHINQSFMWD